MPSLQPLVQEKEIALYRMSGTHPVVRYVTSTPESRRIANDPFFYGVAYTDALETAVARTLQHLWNEKERPSEPSTVVLNILRGGLNYGIRNALHTAFGWNKHSSAFISSQRARDQKGGWYITENRYQKVNLPNHAHVIFGDVVATGVSLEHALLRMVEIAQEQHRVIDAMTFFTIGSQRAEEIMERVDTTCREQFPEYHGSRVVYFEGVFGVPSEESTLHIALSGTDLLRSPAILAPEFVSSQSEAMSYAIERCTIYDAGSRAFHSEEYLEDVHDYWQQVADLATSGMTYTAYLRERFPEDERLTQEDWCAAHDKSDILHHIAGEQLAKQ